MLTAHRTVAFLVLAGTWGAAIAAGLSYYGRREPRGYVTHLIALAQTLLIAQVGLGPSHPHVDTSSRAASALARSASDS